MKTSLWQNYKLSLCPIKPVSLKGNFVIKCLSLKYRGKYLNERQKVDFLLYPILISYAWLSRLVR